MSNAAKRCAVEGCEAVLYERNTTGVCRAHNHAAGICRCYQCGRPPQPEVSPQRQGITQVEAPMAGTYSGVSPTMRVSLPRAPWEQP